MARINSNYIQLKKLANNPPQPPSGEVYFFAKSNGNIAQLDDTNTETNMTGAASELNDLSDFTVSSETEGDYLEYDTGVWVNSAFPTVPSTLDDFSDVNETGVANYDIMMYTTAYKPKNQKACGFAYTTSSLQMSNNETDHLIVTSHANVTTGGDSTMISTDYFSSLDDGGDLDHEGAYILETYLNLSSAGTGEVDVVPVTVDGSDQPTEGTLGAAIPLTTVFIDANTVRVHLWFVFFPPHNNLEFTWKMDSSINSTVDYEFSTTFRPFGHNMNNTALYEP